LSPRSAVPISGEKIKKGLRGEGGLNGERRREGGRKGRKEGWRETDRHSQSERHRQRDRKRQRERQRKKERQRMSERHRERQRGMRGWNRKFERINSTGVNAICKCDPWTYIDMMDAHHSLNVSDTVIVGTRLTKSREK